MSFPKIFLLSNITTFMAEELGTCIMFRQLGASGPLELSIDKKRAFDMFLIMMNICLVTCSLPALSTERKLLVHLLPFT